MDGSDHQFPSTFVEVRGLTKVTDKVMPATFGEKLGDAGHFWMGHGDVPSGKLWAISKYGYILYIYNIVYHNYTIYVVYPLVNSQFASKWP